jgi:hypothetical protein
MNALKLCHARLQQLTTVVGLSSLPLILSLLPLLGAAVIFSRHEPLKAELENFVSAVSNGDAPLVSGEDGLRALQLAHALVQSGRTQQVVELQQ